MEAGPSREDTQKRHPIRVAAKRSGTPESTLRAWERRYEAVNPGRADTGRRLYSDRDIRRLQLLRRALDGGRSISSVARLSDQALSDLIRGDLEARAELPVTGEGGGRANAEFVAVCIKAVEGLDARVLSTTLRRAATKLPVLDLISEVVVPLLHRIGACWYEDRLSPRHEHLATTAVRAVLTQLQVGSFGVGRSTILVATPSGQLHDLGAHFVSALAVTEGWNVVNLGADVPARDIELAAEETGADVVALSLVYPVNDPDVHDALAHLGEHLHRRITLVVGGQAAGSYRESIRAAGAVEADTARALIGVLRAGI